MPNLRRTNSEVDEYCDLAKLGTSKRPAVVRVQSFVRAEKIVLLCDGRAWQVIVGVEPGEPEVRSDIERMPGADSAAGAEGWPQCSLSLRERPEVPEVLRIAMSFDGMWTAFRDG